MCWRSVEDAGASVLDSSSSVWTGQLNHATGAFIARTIFIFFVNYFAVF